MKSSGSPGLSRTTPRNPLEPETGDTVIWNVDSVRRGECSRRIRVLSRNAAPIIDAQLVIAGKQGQGLALQVLHDEEVRALRRDAEIVHFDDVVIADGGDSARLVDESGHDLLIDRQVLVDDLQGESSLVMEAVEQQRRTSARLAEQAAAGGDEAKRAFDAITIARRGTEEAISALRETHPDAWDPRIEAVGLAA